MLVNAEANAKAIRQIAEAIEAPGGLQAVNLRVAEQYITAFAQSREDQQHADRAGQRRRHRGPHRDGDEGGAGRHRKSRGDTQWRLRGSTFVVTGGASGLGAGDGAHGRRRRRQRRRSPTSRKPKAARSPRSSGKTARFVRTDVTDEASGEGGRRGRASNGFGGLQGLVNCAGIVHGEKVVGKEGRTRSPAFARTININLVGTFNLIRLAADAMSAGAPNAEGERGVIVNTASVAAFDGQIGQAAYAASKARHRRHDAADRARACALRHSRDDDRAGHLRDADDGEPCRPRSRSRWARWCRSRRGSDGRRSSRRWSREIVAQPDAERRGDPARRRDPDGAEVTRRRVIPSEARELLS